jgi:hypothetical protein
MKIKEWLRNLKMNKCLNMGESGASLAYKREMMGGWRGDWGLLSGQLLSRGESPKTGVLSVS